MLLSVSWPEIGGLTPLIFVAFIPLLLVEDELAQSAKNGNKRKLFWYSYTTFLSFNIFTTWWVWNASPFGAIAAIIFNALFSAIIFNLFHRTKRVLGSIRGYFGLFILMMGWEYFHMDWDLSWPWLVLGNVFATFPEWVQWYEYTGALGGTLWILASNVLLYHVFKSWRGGIESRFDLVKSTVWSALILILPIGWSYWKYATTNDQGEAIEIVAIQPNIDPYNEKFGSKSSPEQVQEMLDLARQKVTPNTKLVIAPETAIPQSFDEDAVYVTPEYQLLKSFVKEFPQTDILIGASTYHIYKPDEKPGPTARYQKQQQFYYDYCNTAVYLNEEGRVDYYHKSKMVPGVEKMPFPSFFQYFQEFAFNLGGTTGSLADQPNREAFPLSNDSNVVVAPVICYESVYGDFVGDYMSEANATFIAIITNDGWWGNTPGHKQHMHYARLRAIEHRKSIARSANTGISCFINQRGDISQATDWWVADVIQGEVYSNPEKTFYTEFGDFLGRTSLVFSGFLLLYAFIRYKRINSLR